MRSGELVHLPKILAVTCALGALSGCAFQKYRPAPLSPQTTAAKLQSRSLSDSGLHDFVDKTAPSSASTWPIQQWDLAHLTLAAFYYNPALEIARARVSEAEAAIVTAAARPNPTIKGDLGGETSAESPWIAGLGFSLPIETAGKRPRRISAAERLADVARWNLATTAWAVRAQVRSALLEYVAAQRNIEAVQQEERVRAEQVHLLEQRLAVGIIPRPEVDTARIQHTQAFLAAQAAQGRLAQARTSLARAIGVPTHALDGIQFSWPAFDQLPRANSFFPAKIQEDAVLNRLDIRRALADYTAAEAVLRLEIAKQYPDLDLGPDYAFEDGAHLFSIAAGLVLPVFNRNQGPIREALARRQEMAAQFLSVQASGIAASEQALAKYQAALNEVSAAQQLIVQSQAQEQATQESLQAGQSDRVALNAAQLQTAVVQVAQLDALYRAQQALGDLENAAQRPLLPGDIEPLSPQAPVLQAPQRKSQ
jgi:cobalt-zinc-cadmium efflux system outer membrane protein